jgi:alpha-beta hydrolase superfamily lysophospholipase
VPGSRTEAITIPSLDGIPLDALVQRPADPAGAVLLAHGITADYHEVGAFDRLAEALVESGFAVLRFSFRGHGKSGGAQEGMTISGERLDLSAAYGWMAANLPEPYGLLGASFGAVSTTLQLAALHPPPRCFVLWNPALELGNAFGDRLREARERGYAELDGGFRVGQVLLEERLLFPRNLALERLDGSIPTLILHGTEDAAVPLASSQNAAAAPGVELAVLEGAAHGFHEPQWEAEAVRITAAWVARHLAA